MGSVLPKVELGADRTAVSIGAGGERTCAILDSGELKCWGGNANGQLGLGDTQARGLAEGQMGDQLPAVALGTNRTAVALFGETNSHWIAVYHMQPRCPFSVLYSSVCRLKCGM